MMGGAHSIPVLSNEILGQVTSTDCGSFRATLQKCALGCYETFRVARNIDCAVKEWSGFVFPSQTKSCPVMKVTVKPDDGFGMAYKAHYQIIELDDVGKEIQKTYESQKEIMNNAAWFVSSSCPFSYVLRLSEEEVTECGKQFSSVLGYGVSDDWFNSKNPSALYKQGLTNAQIDWRQLGCTVYWILKSTSAGNKVESIHDLKVTDRKELEGDLESCGLVCSKSMAFVMKLIDEGYKYMYIRMDYHIKQLPLHCRIAPPPIFSHEPYPPLASQNSSTVMNELKCVVCSNIVTQPLELPCRKLACTRCVVERVAASSPVCPCCSEDSTLDVLVQCAECHRDVKAGCYEEHECTPSLTFVEEREAAALLKRAVFTFPYDPSDG
eukprot:Em0015g1047a